MFIWSNWLLATVYFSVFIFVYIDSTIMTFLIFQVRSKFEIREMDRKLIIISEKLICHIDRYWKASYFIIFKIMKYSTITYWIEHTNIENTRYKLITSEAKSVEWMTKVLFKILFKSLLSLLITGNSYYSFFSWIWSLTIFSIEIFLECP